MEGDIVKFINILLAICVSLTSIGCASSLKRADAKLGKFHRTVNNAYESIRKFTDPLPLPFKLEPIKDTSFYNDYKHDEPYNPTLGPQQRICVVKGLPAGSSVRVEYLEEDRPQWYSADEKGGKARLIVTTDQVMCIRITDAKTGLTHIYNEVSSSCDFKWHKNKQELEPLYPKEVS